MVNIFPFLYTGEMSPGFWHSVIGLGKSVEAYTREIFYRSVLGAPQMTSVDSSIGHILSLRNYCFHCCFSHSPHVWLRVPHYSFRCDSQGFWMQKMTSSSAKLGKK